MRMLEIHVTLRILCAILVSVFLLLTFFQGSLGLECLDYQVRSPTRSSGIFVLLYDCTRSISQRFPLISRQLFPRRLRGWHHPKVGESEARQQPHCWRARESQSRLRSPLIAQEAEKCRLLRRMDQRRFVRSRGTRAKSGTEHKASMNKRCKWSLKLFFSGSKKNWILNYFLTLKG